MGYNKSMNYLKMILYYMILFWSINYLVREFVVKIISKVIYTIVSNK